MPAHLSGVLIYCNNNSYCSVYLVPPTSRPRVLHKRSWPVLRCPYTESSKCAFSLQWNESVYHSIFKAACRLYRACSTVTEKALLLVHCHVHGTVVVVVIMCFTSHVTSTVELRHSTIYMIW